MQNRIAAYARALAWGWARRHAPRRWFFVWLALAALGCSGPSLHEFRLVGGSEAERTEVRRAALAWNRAARRIVIAETADGDAVYLDSLCEWISETEQSVAVEHPDGTIRICLRAVEEMGCLQSVAAHEFGHALGLADTFRVETDTIMGLGCAPGPTESDGESV